MSRPHWPEESPSSKKDTSTRQWHGPKPAEYSTHLEIRDLGIWAASTLLPDLTILFDVGPHIAAPADKLTTDERLKFHHELRNCFLGIARRDPLRFLVVDAEQPFDEVAAIVADRLMLRFTE